ncbi:UDP-N-acetylmuramoyl-tripeptide--D-alanyl-D-alanine ligase [bacterium]|nr:UDP-N-acetylmuramoyl-tripeptide--D-alanyl-D-alanine ligase [bacterium]
MFIIAFITFMFFVYRRSLLSLHFLQQEGYENKNFFKFIFHKLQLIDKYLTVVVFLYTVLSVGYKNYIIDMSVLSLIFLIFAFIQINPMSATSKKKLVLTLRAKRILYLSIIIDAVLAGIIFYTLHTLKNYCLCEDVGYLLLLIQVIPFMLIVSNILLKPFELLVRHKYVKEAEKRLNEVNPIVIGITGSFGKTSTKNILHHIVSSVAPTLTTARSINTLMGITQVIRSDLKKNHKYFIVEVGTSAKGKIKKICSLIKPKFGILTAVGFAHFANFKNQESLAKEKMDLIKSVNSNNGVSVINTLQVDKKFIPDMANLIFLSDTVENKNTYKISNIKQDINGVNFVLSFGGKNYKIEAPIFGLHQANNISMAIILAFKLGIPTDTIIASLKTLKQVEHRLEVKKQPNGITIIDDGFNSNVDGFVSALNTLRTLANNGRAILITPGMVELGKKHKEHHIRVAKEALLKCDIVIAVVPERIKDFVDTFKNSMNKNQQLILVGSFKEALAWTTKNAKKGDVILYENDLPDLFETKIRI